MTEEELKKKCTERAKIFQQAMESCKSSSPMDCIEWFADRIADLEKENAELKETVTKMNNVITETFRNLSKAKVVLRNVIDYLGQFCSDYPDCVIEAELFLKDSEVEK